MEVRLFSARTGEWDPVYLHTPDFFSGWNWPGSSDDLEIVVPVVGKPNSSVAQPLTVTVTSVHRARVVERRRFTGLWLRENGVSYQVVVIKNAHCAGGLEVTAKLGTETKKLLLSLDCGE